MTVPYLFVLAKAIAPCLIFPNLDTKSEFSYLDSESIEATGRTDSAWVGHLELDVQLEEALVVLAQRADSIGPYLSWSVRSIFPYSKNP